MNKAAPAALFKTREMMGGDRPAAQPGFSRPSMEGDLSRPPEPGTFRFSLQEMRRRVSSVSRRPSPRSSAHAPAENHDAARAAASRRPDKQAPVRKHSEKRPRPAAGAGRGRESEPASPADRERPHVSPQDAPGSGREAPPTAPAERQGSAVAAQDNGQLPQEATAAVVSAEENTAKAAGGQSARVSSAVAAGTGSPSGDAGTAFTVAPSPAGDEGVSQTESSAKPDAVQPAAQESGGGSKKNVTALTAKKPAGKRAGGAGKPGVTPSPGESAKTEAAAVTPARAPAAASPRAAGNEALQVHPQTPPAVSRDSAASPAQTGEAATVAPKGSSAGRVVRIGADSQSGQTGLFQAHQGPSAGVQAGGGPGAPPAPAAPLEHDLLQQVAEKTVFHLKNGRIEARIDLKPESLGHLRLHVSTDNGQVTLRIMTESPWVRDMIESNISQLKNELQQHNLQIDRLDVSVSGGGQESAGGKNPRPPGSPAEAAAADGESVPAADETETRLPPARRTGEGLVDYFA